MENNIEITKKYMIFAYEIMHYVPISMTTINAYKNKYYFRSQMDMEKYKKDENC